MHTDVMLLALEISGISGLIIVFLSSQSICAVLFVAVFSALNDLKKNIKPLYELEKS
jgi:hypothetical protein